MAQKITRKLTLAGIGLAGVSGLLAFALIGPGAALAEPSPSPSASASAKADRDAKRAQHQQQRNEVAQQHQNAIAETTNGRVLL